MEGEHLPLFINYSGAQMDYAVKYLKTNPNVDLVTINIGGNDLALVQMQFRTTCSYSKLPARSQLRAKSHADLQQDPAAGRLQRESGCAHLLLV